MPQKHKITRNGQYPLNRDYKSSGSAVYLSGVAGGATMALAFGNAKGDVVVLKDSAGLDVVISPSTQNLLDHGVDQVIYGVVTGATGTTELYVESYEVT